MDDIANEVRYLVRTISAGELRHNERFRSKLRHLLQMIHGPDVNEWTLLGPIIGRPASIASQFRRVV